MPVQRQVFISVAEESADLHGASLVRVAQQHLPDCAFYGLTGSRLRDLGVATLYDFASHAAMLSGVLKVVRHARAALRTVHAAWEARRPDAVVLLDSPELHLRLATLAHRLRIPVLYYIAPQTWASRAYRNRRIARDIDRLACILPFEQAYFRRHGVLAEFVGHPLFEALRRAQPDEQVVARLRGPGTPLVALLPGSRAHVIESLLPRQLEVLHRLRARRSDIRGAISCVSPARLPQIRSHRSRAGIAADIIVGDNASLLSAADIVLVASGTATLEVAYYRKPMIVMYDAGSLLRWPYRLFGQRLLTTSHLSLVNILANARVVPEFMPFIPDVREVAEVAFQLLTDEPWQRLMVRQLNEIVAPLEDSQASLRTCALLADLLGYRRGEQPAVTAQRTAADLPEPLQEKSVPGAHGVAVETPRLR